LITFPNTSEIAIRVADFTITIRKSSNCPTLFLEKGYKEYQTALISDVDSVVTAYSKIPEHLNTKADLLYKATREDQDFWSISRHQDGYKLTTYSQSNPGIIQQIAVIDADFKDWKIYTETITDPQSGEAGVCPLEYPMGPLLFYYLTVKNEAIMIHASGINDDAVGRIFSGFSGVGKSTMAKIWESKGSQIINDDRLIIRKQGDNYYIHNTPMVYVDTPKKVKLHTLYLPYHSPINKAEILSPAKAVSKLLAYCIIHGYKKEHLEHHLDFLAAISTKHTTTRLGVVPDQNIIEFIKKNENEHSVH